MKNKTKLTTYSGGDVDLEIRSGKHRYSVHVEQSDGELFAHIFEDESRLRGYRVISDGVDVWDSLEFLLYVLRERRPSGMCDSCFDSLTGTIARTQRKFA